MKKTIEVCQICENAKCDGIAYASQPFHIVLEDRKPEVRVTCKRRDEIVTRNGKEFLKWVRGMGHIDYIPVTKIVEA